MELLRRLMARLNVFAVVEALLTLAALTLVAVTVGGQLGHILGLHGTLGLAAGWSIAIVYDALWIGALRMSEQAIRLRSRVGMIVMLGLSAVAVGVSTGTLLVLGHAQVFAFVPVAAALFMGLRLFAGNVLADGATAAQIAEQSAGDRNARALAAADARHMRVEARTDVVAETASHLASVERQVAQSQMLTKGQKQIDKARAKAEKKLTKSDERHGEKARAFAARRLEGAVPQPVVTAVSAGRGDQEGHAVVTQVTPQIAPVVTSPASRDESGVQVPGETAGHQTPVQNPMKLQELADAAGVPVPQKDSKLSDEQLDVVLRWLRYNMDPPRSYRQAQDEFRARGFRAREERVRTSWRAIEARETGAPAR
ncbi:hypothetical protein [Streptomyces sp.]|uniref:hypothetical protein n=1 Tax=Streptomyces sp. TaxID=1931 RepID=UPI002810BD1A|nr:hypothetical protein [Streptomyces sp.]